MTAQRNQEAWDALRRERDELAAQNAVMRSALDAMVKSAAGMGCGLRIADEALALPNTSADILRQRDARTLLEMAEKLEDFYATGGAAVDAVMLVRKAANKLENGK